LGLAFHPDYKSNGLLYVNLTNTQGNTVIREFQVANPAANQATIVSQRTIITYDQPFRNHNGGWIDFGPDNFLYISSGDGGSGNDPNNNAQDITNNKLGKILRIDVNGDAFPSDANRNYAIPPSNPFVGQTGDDEIWAYGVRNPWRASFDRATGDLWFGDVGQNNVEEINFQPAGSLGGENYGWRIFEGSRENIGTGAAGTVFDGSDKVFPIFEYDHGQGSSVTGGYVYRGPIEALQGKYFFADFGSGNIWTAEPDGQGGFDVNNVTSLFTTDAGSIGNIASFAEDGVGNLYIIDIFGGQLFQITAVPLPLPMVLMLSALAGMAPISFRRKLLTVHS
jgi:glucose/arabinose dehydrogenase